MFKLNDNADVLAELVRREVIHNLGQTVAHLIQAGGTEYLDQDELYDLSRRRRLDWEQGLEDDAGHVTRQTSDCDLVAFESDRQAFIGMASFPGCLPESREVFRTQADAWEWLAELADPDASGGIAEVFGEDHDEDECGSARALTGGSELVYEVAEIDAGDLSTEEAEEILDAVTLDDADAIREYCEDNDIEPYEDEAYEYWAVSRWFAEKLAEQGEVTAEVLDFHVWGRTCTGQAIYLDGVIERIAADMEILKGQRYDWTK